MAIAMAIKTVLVAAASISPRARINIVKRIANIKVRLQARIRAAVGEFKTNKWL